jgi:DnaK suppressor protein
MARRDAWLRLHKSLLARRAALRNALAAELEDLRKLRTDQTGDSIDAAFDSGCEEIATQLAQREVRELKQVERALTRLKQGTYGICEVCQGKIPVARLNALPFGTTCINCQREMDSHSGWDSQRGGNWERVCDGEPALEEQRDIDLTKIEMDLSRNR